jgi:hypothetical protein
MAIRRITLLFLTTALTTALIVGLSTCTAPDTEEQATTSTGQIAHFPLIEAPDSFNVMHVFRLNGRAVEAVFFAPASNGRAGLISVIEQYGFTETDMLDRDLFSFLNDSTVLVPELLPDSATSATILALDVSTEGLVGSAVINGQQRSLLFADPGAWGKAPPTPGEMIAFSFRLGSAGPQGTEQRGSGWLISTSYRVADPLGISTHNPDGSDDCLKIRDCELRCDEAH